MYKITAPDKAYSGKGYGLTFADGVATTGDKRVADYLRARGYSVDSMDEKPKDTPKEPPKAK